MKIKRTFRWPPTNEGGKFKIGCSCGWDFIGVPSEIFVEGMKHDDSPDSNHVVYIVGQVIEDDNED